MPAGRPSIYRPEMCEQMVQFFDREPYAYDERTGKFESVPVPFFVDFAKTLGITSVTLGEWSKDEEKPEFVSAYKHCKALQEKILVTNGLKGYYNPIAFIFTAKNVLGWRDNKEIDYTSKGKEIKSLTLGGEKVASIGTKYEEELKKELIKNIGEV